MSNPNPPPEPALPPLPRFRPSLDEEETKPSRKLTPPLACNKVKPFPCGGCMSHAGFREGGEGGGQRDGRRDGRRGGRRAEGWEEGWEEGRWEGDGEETYSHEFRKNHATIRRRRVSLYYSIAATVLLLRLQDTRTQCRGSARAHPTGRRLVRLLRGACFAFVLRLGSTPENSELSLQLSRKIGDGPVAEQPAPALVGVRGRRRRLIFD